MSIRRTVFFGMCAAFVLAAVAAAAGRGVSFASPDAAIPELFEPAAAADGAPVGAPDAVRARPVALNRDLLADGAAGAQIRLNLFDDVAVTVRRDRVEPNAGGGFTWYGSLADRPAGEVIFATAGDATVGNVYLGSGELYQVRHTAAGVAVVQEIDQSRFPEEAPPIEIGPAELAAAAEGRVRGDRADAPQGLDAEDCNRIDVMVVYDAAARTAAGGADAMLAEIYLGVAETNQAYANSAVNQRVGLVHVAEVAVAVGTSATGALGNIKADAGVQALRDTYGADLVSYWVGSLPGACGIAYKMNTVSSAFAAFGYSVVDRTCATGYYSFGHEMGHNMGLGHDWYVDAGTTPYTYAHGHVSVPGKWRTIMAYNSLCQAQTPAVNCTRLPYFSNPGVSIGGVSTGVAAGTSTACTTGNLNNPACDADDHLTLNNTACTVAAFRATSPGRNDVWMKDTWLDTGKEPDPATAGQAMWMSPYIWVRTADDPGLVHQHEHQNPESAWTNHVFVKLHNGGAGAASGRLHLYYAQASSGLAWPANWTEFADIPVTVNGDSSTVATAPWKTTAAQTGHFCLLARWVSTADPMAAAETADVNQNTRANNNIAWRNVNIVNLVSPDQLAQSVQMIVRNIERESAEVGLVFTLPTVGQGLPFVRGGRVTVRLGERLMRAWEAGGRKGFGVEPIGDGELMVYSPRGARLEGLEMGPGEEDVVDVRFEASPEQVGTTRQAFAFEIAQTVNGMPAPVGGVAYQIEVAPPASELGQVSGVVFHDRDGDGVRDEEREPGLAEREVVFTDARGRSRAVRSDAFGLYAIALAPDAYTVTQSLPDGWTQTTPATAAVSLDVGAGQAVWDVDFGSVEKAAGPAVTPGGRLVNLSTRGMVGTGDAVLIGGFVVRDRPATVVVRAIGPSLAAHGVSGALANPTLDIYSGQTVIAANDDWASDAAADRLRALGLAPASGRESATVLTLAPGAYTAIVRGARATTGIGLVEVFVVDTPAADAGPAGAPAAPADQGGVATKPRPAAAPGR